MKEPANQAEWQDAVDLAHSAQLILAARAYGLITGGPELNEQRCEELLERGRKLGVVPSAFANTKLVRALTTLQSEPKGAV